MPDDITEINIEYTPVLFLAITNAKNTYLDDFQQLKCIMNED